MASPAQLVPTGVRPDRIAMLFQEMLTIVVRIRASRLPVSDADHFRGQVRAGLISAQEEAHRRGYNRQDAYMAAQAVVAFLDESILNSQNPALRDWVRQPIGPEYFQQHVAGEVYFKNVSDLLTGDDSDRTADMLEVYQLCLLCGYRGKYGVGQERDVKMITDRIAEKMQRIRRTPAELAPFWHPGQDAAPQQADVWGTRLRYGAIGMVAAFVVLFLLYWFLLRTDVTGLLTARVGQASACAGLQSRLTPAKTGAQAQACPTSGGVQC
jgi:type VI secretion system protein ImpK